MQKENKQKRVKKKEGDDGNKQKSDSRPWDHFASFKNVPLLLS